MASELGGSFPGVGDGFGEGIVPSFLRRGRVPESSVRPGSVGQRLVSDAVDGSLGAKWSDAASPYYAAMYLDNTGSPAHTNSGSWQNVADGSGGGAGTDTWVQVCDVRPSGVSAQLDLDTDDGTITVRKSGVYLLHYKIAFSSLAAGYLIGAGVSIANAATPTYATSRTTGATASGFVGDSELVSLSSGDVLTLMAYQNTGVNQAYIAADHWTKFGIMYVGPSS